MLDQSAELVKFAKVTSNNLLMNKISLQLSNGPRTEVIIYFRFIVTLPL